MIKNTTILIYCITLVQGAVLSALSDDSQLMKFINTSEINLIEHQVAIESVYTTKEIPQNLLLPQEIAHHSYDYLTILKGKIITDASFIDLANCLFSFSKMRGIQYYSVTRGKQKQLIFDSYSIAHPNKRDSIADPYATNFHSSYNSYYYQKDNRTGGLLYKATLKRAKDNSLIFTTTNIRKSTRYLIIKINPNDIYRYIRLLPTEKGYYYYIAMAVKVPKILPRKSTAKESFLNRSRAILNYFNSQLNRNEKDFIDFSLK